MDFLSGNKDSKKSSSSSSNQQGQPKEDYVDKGMSSKFTLPFGVSNHSSPSSPSSSRPSSSSFRPRAKSLAAPCRSSVTATAVTSRSPTSSRSSSASSRKSSKSNSTQSSSSSLISFPPPEQVNDSISIPSTPCAESAPSSSTVIGPEDPLLIKTPIEKPTFSFVAPRAFGMAASKSGHEVDRNTSEKITDSGRGLYEKATGTKVSDKVSN
ncbi:hypothetical protein MKZ38_002841 [Zalerion maritima]|uniref:Uncharacterized protein n=1 Tax=Zalerion maritima TaxID=339359 RepID=A0AAD5RWW6_9PEZI|nr:hypothetical protein MKZ38_002841 [Zalerion maritima]